MPPDARPVPDGTEWTDEVGNVWTSHGADVTATAAELAAEVEVEQIK